MVIEITITAFITIRMAEIITDIVIINFTTDITTDTGIIKSMTGITVGMVIIKIMTENITGDNYVALSKLGRIL